MNLSLREEVTLMLHDWKRDVDLRAAGATCPMLNCGVLVIAYEETPSGREDFLQATRRWNFVCQECGAEFTAAQEDLLFQAVPREWLFSEVCHA